MTIEQERGAVAGRNLLLFDGLCGLCHGTVRFLMRHDRRERLRYAPLESALGREMLARVDGGADGPGIVLLEGVLTAGERVSRRSDAAVRALTLLGGGWAMTGWLLGRVPRRVREFGYGVVARWRYRVFGAFEVCPLPSPAERRLVFGQSD